MIIELGYAVNQTEAFPIAPAGWGLANGFCHPFPVPENWPAIELASASMDSCRSQLTWSYSSIALVFTCARLLSRAFPQR